MTQDNKSCFLMVNNQTLEYKIIFDAVLAQFTEDNDFDWEIEVACSSKEEALAYYEEYFKEV